MSALKNSLIGMTQTDRVQAIQRLQAWLKTQTDPAAFSLLSLLENLMYMSTPDLKKSPLWNSFTAFEPLPFYRTMLTQL
jgi:hypothetical protein